MLPETGTTFDGSDCIDDTEGEDALDWTRDNSQCKGLRIVLVPRLNVECKQSYLRSVVALMFWKDLGMILEVKSISNVLPPKRVKTVSQP